MKIENWQISVRLTATITQFRKQNATESGNSERVNKIFNSHKDREYLIISDEYSERNHT